MHCFQDELISVDSSLNFIRKVQILYSNGIPTSLFKKLENQQLFSMKVKEKFNFDGSIFSSRYNNLKKADYILFV